MYPALMEDKFCGFRGEFYAYDECFDGELLFYYGRELNGDYLFMTMHKSDYKRRVFDPNNMDIQYFDTTKLMRMCPTDVANLRHKINCSVCEDEVSREVRFDSEYWGVCEFLGCDVCNSQLDQDVPNFDY